MVTAAVILGASGFLGRNLISEFTSKNIVTYSVLRNPSVAIENRQLFGASPILDFETWHDSLGELRAKFKNLIVVNCVALADIEACDKSPELAQFTNVDFAVKAAKLCQKSNVPLIHISTDSVFPNDGSTPTPHYWSTKASPNPETVYGKTKVAAEKGLAQVGWGHCLRFSFVGPSLGTKRGLIAFLAKQIKTAASHVPGFTDVWFSPLHTHQVARGLQTQASILEPGFSIQHWGSYPGMTKFSFLHDVLNRAGIHLSVEAVSLKKVSTTARPLDQTLASKHAWSAQEMLDLCAQSLKNELLDL